jgi:hypothetical protein
LSPAYERAADVAEVVDHDVYTTHNQYAYAEARLRRPLTSFRL